MARVFVHAADIDDGRLTRMQVKLGSLPTRIIDRATAVSWMRDSHSFVPSTNGSEGPALQLVEIAGEEGVEHFIRTDNAAEAADAMPSSLPAVAG